MPNTQKCLSGWLILLITACSCQSSLAKKDSELYVVVLGVAQDGGYPQAGCKKECCRWARANPGEARFVSSIAVVDNVAKQRFLFDCSPNFPDQLALLDSKSSFQSTNIIDGIFLTHAHVGHYAGMIHLGREVIGSKSVPVHGTKSMAHFLKSNGPWNQLVELENIRIREFEIDTWIQLNSRLKVKPFKVPHRDEFTDTVGFKIVGPNRSVIYLPDIDKWSQWDQSIEKFVQECDIALLDGTFMSEGEIPGRNMSEIPHPFIDESISQFGSMNSKIRKRIKFIHLNHTNPAIRCSGDPQRNGTARRIYNAGLGLANQGEIIPLDN